MGRGHRASGIKVAAALAVALIGAPAHGEPDKAGNGAPRPASVDGVDTDGAASDMMTVVLNSPASLSLGANRMMINVMTADGLHLGKVDEKASLSLQHAQGSMDVPLRWIARPGTTAGGFRAAQVHFDHPGDWFASVVLAGQRAQPTFFRVAPKQLLPSVGEKAIASTSMTLGEGNALSDVTSDREPEPDFYRRSVAEAVGGGKPSIIALPPQSSAAQPPAAPCSTN